MRFLVGDGELKGRKAISVWKFSWRNVTYTHEVRMWKWYIRCFFLGSNLHFPGGTENKKDYRLSARPVIRPKPIQGYLPNKNQAFYHFTQLLL
jgi:hypothetical protein